jgi:predicted amidohydrolase
LSYDIDILVGVALKQSSKFYNSAIYFAKGKYHIHNKVTLPNYGMFEEARFFFGGDNILSFDTDYGKSVVAICEDLWSSQNIDKIVSLNPDTVFILAASPARGFESDGLEIEAQWDSILRTVALLSGAYVVFVNRVGFEDGLGFWGGSRVINPKGLDEFKLPLIDEKVDSFLINHQLSHTQKYIKRNK